MDPTEILTQFCRTVEAGDAAAFAALFTEDGTWDTAFGVGKGRSGIADQARAIAAIGAPRPRRVHLVTNIVIELNGDTATVQSNWALVQNTGAAPNIGSAGGYADRMVRQNGRWYIAYRKIDRFIADGLQ